MKRTLFLSVAAIVFLTLIWVFAPTARRTVVGLSTIRSRQGITLSVANLRANEQIAIVYRTLGCFHYRERLYQIAGGSYRQFLAAKVHANQREEDETRGSERLIGTKRMTAEEEIGLDSYLMFLRRDYEGGCTTTDEIVVGYYRDGRKVGEERFLDTTCQMQDFRIEGEKIVGPDRSYFPPFPIEVLRETVPPWLIERRVKKPNPESSVSQPRAVRGQAARS